MDVTVKLELLENQSLGIGFSQLESPPYCQVAKLQEKGAAKESGKIHEGDTLLSINSKDVRGLNPEEVREMLQSLPKSAGVTLGLHRAAVNGGLTVENGPSITLKTSSPETSPRMGRRRRAGVISGLADRLPDIDESSLLPTGGLHPPQDKKRYSLTPQTSRKQEQPHRMPIKTAKSLDLSNLPQWRQQAMQMVPLRNVQDGSELHDRLHNQQIKFKDTGCHPTHCMGSHLWPKEHKPKRPYGYPRPPDEMIPLAEDFIKQYYESQRHALGNNYDEKLSQRLSAVKKEIEEKGHYDLTYEELAFGARTAWRNAPRCVNRIVWRQLEVLDARDVNTPKEMFDAICYHIKYGNNGGNLRSTITIFRHRVKPRSDFRVWNSQLIRYAGYRQEDGSILGDPSNVEFTEICERLGWQPPKVPGPFDVLPLVLQANGGDPQWFEIPPELVIEVEITHPHYPWFQSLGLRWYGLPAVSSMMLDVGGLEFTGIPFNGWYMVTEIGRDLGDADRYNMLKPIAQKLGLNTQTYKMWKDRAMIELNIAILHSYQKANVSLVDHHSATESFMTHMKAESQTRGGCPADWVWIVPPISGSLTPVFHQEMLLYYLTPSYEYQDDPWKHYALPSKAGEGSRERSSSLTFRTVAHMIRDTTRLYRKFYQKRVKATVLYATETGRSRSYANIVKDVFGKVFAAKVVCMEDYDRTNLEHEQLLLVVTSTFGSGDPPANGETFGRYMLDLRNGAVAPGMAPVASTPRSHRMSTIVAPSREALEGKQGTNKPLTQVKYAVFGLGSRAYPNFCTFGHTCDNLLKDLGAEQLVPCGEGDEMCGQEESFQSWLQECYVKACETYKLDSRLQEGELVGYQMGYSKENYRVRHYEYPQPERDICLNLRNVHSKEVYPAVFKSRSKLQSTQSDRSTIRVVVDTKGTRLHYVPGDHIAIYPQNNTKLVNDLLERLSLPCKPDDPIFVECRREPSIGGLATWSEERRLPVPVTVREAFTNYLDITNPPTPQFLKLLAQQATKVTDQLEIMQLAKGGNKYEDWKYERFPNMIDVMNQFHSLKINVTLLLQQLPLLQCRYYSISSSPKMHPNEVHATVAIVSFRKRSGTGPRHHGVCSTWLNRIEPGTIVPCFIRKAHAFHMPDTPRTPMIMVGPGTGIAPFRSFWQDRMFARNEALKMQLSTPSQTSQLKLQPVQQAPFQRKRRQTSITAPRTSQLVRYPTVVETPTSTGPIPIRRSASDAEDTEKLSKMLASRQKQWGSMTLYFGCRRSDMDFIYKEELKKAQVTGALTEVNVALSREPGQPKTYVQHLLKKNADKVVKQLIEERGHFYVCGDISMAADVCRTLQSIIEENAAMSAEQARKLIETMKDKGRYHEDIFGVTLKTAEVTTRVRTAAKKAWRVLVSEDGSHVLGTPSTPLPRTPRSPMTPMHPYTPAVKESPTHHLIISGKRPTVTVLVNSPAETESENKAFRLSAPDVPVTTSTRKHYPIEGGEGGPKMITVEEAETNIMEPLTESPGEETSPKPIPPTPEVQSTEAAQETPSVQEIAPKPTPPSPGGAQQVVQQRNMSSEKKKLRRIRTNSKVESVI